MKKKYSTILHRLKDHTYGEPESDSLNIEISKEEIKLSNVVGLKKEKEELLEVIDFLENPNKYTEIGMKIPKGVLLVGPSGAGKTYLIKAILNEVKDKVVSLMVDGIDLNDVHAERSFSIITKLFKEAKLNAPAIIFIDNIDALGLTLRNKSMALIQLLIEMEKLASNNNVIVFAATNCIENVEPKLLNPGYFDKIIGIDLPGARDREEILKYYSKTKKVEKDINFTSLAYNTMGFSAAELEELLNDAALITIRKKQTMITQDCIFEALKISVLGSQEEDDDVSEKEKKLIAFHEAGHAVVNKYLTTQDNVKEISIISRGVAGGYNWNETVEEKRFITKKELKEELVSLLGGRGAEYIALGDYSTGSTSDLQVATQIAKNMICVYGMNEEIGPVLLNGLNSEYFDKTIVGKEITKILKEAEREASNILRENRKFLDKVAEKLLEKETISGEEFNEIYEEYEEYKNLK